MYIPFVRMVKNKFLAQFPVRSSLMLFLCKLFSFAYYFVHLWVFCTIVSGWFHTGVKWQQVSSILQDSYQYSSWSQQCCSLGGLHSSSYVQVLQSLYQSFGDRDRVTIPFMFTVFFSSLARSKYLSLSSLSFSCGQPEWQSQVLFFLLTVTKSSRLAEIRRSVCISKSQWSLCISFSRVDSGLFMWSNLNFLHSSRWIILATLSCLV